jgi:hypothetical protein
LKHSTPKLIALTNTLCCLAINEGFRTGDYQLNSVTGDDVFFNTPNRVASQSKRLMSPYSSIKMLSNIVLLPLGTQSCNCRQPFRCLANTRLRKQMEDKSRGLNLQCIQTSTICQYSQLHPCQQEKETERGPTDTVIHSMIILCISLLSASSLVPLRCKYPWRGISIQVKEVLSQ